MDTGALQLGAYATPEGVTFSVWAPFADAVAVTGDFCDWSENGVSLRKIPSGHWRVLVDAAEVGQEYKFILWNAGQRILKNDPRALQISFGESNSVIVDRNFDWAGDNFVMRPVEEQIIYEMHVGTFFRKDPAIPGTFATAIEKLDYLADLGITTIELLPCSEMGTKRWWGYTPNFIFAIEAIYGGRRAFQEFVKAAHLRGIGVIMDVVYNHLNPDESLSIWRFDGWHENGFGGIYFYNDWRAVTPWGDTRLDYGRAEVREYIYDNVRMWLSECHVDGLRVDSTHNIRNAKGWTGDPSNDIPEGWQVLQSITTAAHEIRPDSLLIAEDGATEAAITRSVATGGAGFSAQWETSLPFTLRDILTSPDDASRHFQQLVDAATKSYNNDPFQKVVFSESHDADANGRSRLNEEIAPGDGDNIFARRRAILAAAIILTIPGVPMLFQGQEFMEIGAFSYWRQLDWQKAEEFTGILQLYKDVIALRLNKYGTSRGLLGRGFEVLAADDESKLFAYHRYSDDGDAGNVVVVANFSNVPLHDIAVKFPLDGKWHVRCNSDWKGYSADFSDTQILHSVVHEGQGVVSVGPYSLLIFSRA